MQHKVSVPLNVGQHSVCKHRYKPTMETIVKCCMPTKCETYGCHVMPFDWCWFLAALKSYTSSNKLMFTLVDHVSISLTVSKCRIVQLSVSIFLFLVNVFFGGRKWRCPSWLFAKVHCSLWMEEEWLRCLSWMLCSNCSLVLMWAHLFRMGDSVQQLSVQQLFKSIKIINFMIFSIEVDQQWMHFVYKLLSLITFQIFPFKKELTFAY